MSEKINNKLIKFIKPDFVHSDERGKLRQISSNGKWKQINVITSSKGLTRGNHYHKHNREAFFIIYGKFNLILENGKEKEKYIIKAEDFFIIEPNTIHTFEFLEDTTLVALYDKGVEEENGKKDIYSN